MAETKNNKKTNSVEILLESIPGKIITSIYIIVLATFVSYQTSKVFYEQIWPNERFAVVTFMMLMLVVPYFYMLLNKVRMYKNILLYHFIVVFTALCMTISYGIRPIYLIIMIAALFTDFYTGVVVTTAVCGFGFFSMASEPEFFFTIVSLFIGMMCSFVAKEYKNIRTNIVLAIATVIMNSGMHMVFQKYCEESYVEYIGISFILKANIGLVSTFVLYFGAKYAVMRFVLKQGTKRQFKDITKDNAKGIKLLKEKSLSLYYHSKDVAEMSKNAAIEIGANPYIAYAGGMYHDIGKLFGKEYVKEGIKYAKKNGLPREVCSIILTHNVKVNYPKTKEAAIVMLADTAASAAMYLKSKESKNVNEKTVIENALIQRLGSGTLNESGLSIEEFYKIKQSFIKTEES